MPTYALVDVLRCATQAPERLREVFGGRLVFIGSVLPVEDRAVPSSRYLSRTVPPADDPKAACALPRLASAAPKSRSVPGVYVHASAADAALTGEHLRPVPVWFRIGLAGLAGGLGAVVGMVLAPWTAVVLALLSILALWAGEVVLIESRLWLPAALPMLAVAVSTGLGYLVHYLVEERRRLSIQRAFGRYLAPSLVESLADDPNALHLGGTVRPVTVMFADLSGFTALSTKVGPEELVALTNQYLALVSDEVDDSGGYVDKYIGDAVMAIWGAPVADPEHARHAVDAGFKALQRIQEAARQAAARGEHGFGIKIGVYSGEAIVGNVGSEKRYNYTAVGETVNVAARMESLPGVYGCSFLIGPTTAAAVDDEMLLREIDWVAVKGRAEPLTIFEPLAQGDAASEAERAAAKGYAEALALYRQRRFAEAAECWQAAGPEDGPAQMMAARARAFAETPPDADWDGVNVMEGK
jgi:adenylate cyclase